MLRPSILEAWDLGSKLLPYLIILDKAQFKRHRKIPIHFYIKQGTSLA